MTREEFKERYPFLMQGRVEWADMDAFQHVNNTVYFRYFERLRIAFFEHMGIITHRREHGIGPILHSTRCRFRAPLTFPDTIDIGASIGEIQADRFVMNYGIFSEKLATLAAEGDGLVVYYDYTKGEKAVMPPEISKGLQAFARGAKSGG